MSQVLLPFARPLRTDTLYVITGPTASGKTALALELAKSEGAEIISCDSLLFYRGMDIGTAKPSAQERQSVTHWGIDLVAPSEPYSVGRYGVESVRWVESIHQRGVPIIIVGGSGFYLKSFWERSVDAVAFSEETQDRVQQWYEEGGLEKIVRELEQRNPDGLGSLDKKNPRRVLSYLKRCVQTGQSIQAQRRAFDAQAPPFPNFHKQLHCIDLPDDALKERIQSRTQRMLEAGLIAEVEQLRVAGIEQNPSAAKAIGYRETLAYLDGKMATLEDLGEQISHHTWKLVKKQRTWFRGQMAGLLQPQSKGLPL